MNESGSPQEPDHLQELLAQRQKGRERGIVYREYMYQSVSGLEVGVGIALGTVLGHFADKQFNTHPWGTLIGLGFGVIHACRVLYKLAKREQRKAAKSAAAAQDKSDTEQRASRP